MAEWRLALGGRNPGRGQVRALAREQWLSAAAGAPPSVASLSGPVMFVVRIENALYRTKTCR